MDEETPDRRLDVEIVELDFSNPDLEALERYARTGEMLIPRRWIPTPEDDQRDG